MNMLKSTRNTKYFTKHAVLYNNVSRNLFIYTFFFLDKNVDFVLEIQIKNK